LGAFGVPSGPLSNINSAHLFHMCFTCVSHVFHMCFTCVSHDSHTSNTRFWTAWAPKKEYVSELGSKTVSEVGPNGTLKLVLGSFASNRRTFQKHRFLLSQTHILHFLGSTISSKRQLRNSAKNVFEKVSQRNTAKRSKDQLWDAKGGKMSG
jgi:hypothetical protein